MHYAGIDLKEGNEIIISGLGEKLEIWNKSAYEANVLGDGMEDGFDFGDLAEEVRRDIEPKA